ncbi:replication fork protection component swi3 domain-containing protein [Trichoderma breve]|uniref:Chromosome segregation in meiosis protein n=1 Tax=Trichoderma breve TaxID=2034170 RepID=A0A9W9JT74_9HYPO|nr:replication fork protection component swi3 domain-containing protein [Trichoderma breve]KAJ4865352.1 replication fork protection component swi3 domain-containing protein [Trichoderma breve]
MPSAAKFGRLLEEHGDDLDDYGLDDSDNPFGSPTPPPESSSKKRKEPDSGLGIEEEVSVQKRVRVPNVKLDEERLLGPAGIPKLRRRAFGLKLKGKGHEFSDASRLLSFYQLWLDDLFPKARFLDALAMVEKAGHKKALVSARSEWINEGRPKASNDDDDELDIGAVAITEDSQVTEGGIPAQRTQKTPERDDIPDDDDLYGATPRGPARTADALRPAPSNDAPDDDDLEALMAEAENEEDDLDALIAEAEVQDRSSGHSAENGTSNTTSNDKGHDFADEEEAMQEMEGLW